MKARKPGPTAETIYRETSPGGAFRFEVYQERSLFKVRTERRIEDDYMGPGWSGWIPVSPDMAHIADTLERAVELGRESLRCLDGESLSGKNTQ